MDIWSQSMTLYWLTTIFLNERLTTIWLELVGTWHSRSIYQVYGEAPTVSSKWQDGHMRWTLFLAFSTEDPPIYLKNSYLYIRPYIRPYRSLLWLNCTGDVLLNTASSLDISCSCSVGKWTIPLFYDGVFWEILTGKICLRGRNLGNFFGSLFLDIHIMYM